MKLTIGASTPLSVEKGEVVVEQGCVILYEHKAKDKKKVGLGECAYSRELIVAYCLHPGESVRRIQEGEFDVQQ